MRQIYTSTALKMHTPKTFAASPLTVYSCCRFHLLFNLFFHWKKEEEKEEGENPFICKNK